MDQCDVIGVDGLVGWLRGLDERWASSEERVAILFSARAIESELSLSDLSAHLIAVTIQRR
jgi:hypothetical protein